MSAYPNGFDKIKKTQPQAQVAYVEDPLNVFRFENEWNASFCGCGEDFKLCFCTYFCWLCVFCTLMSDLRENCCTWCCVPHPLILFRTKMRSNLRIKGSIWRDSLTSLIFPWCTVLQMKNELKYRGLTK